MCEHSIISGGRGPSGWEHVSNQDVGIPPHYRYMVLHSISVTGVQWDMLLASMAVVAGELRHAYKLAGKLTFCSRKKVNLAVKSVFKLLGN